MSEQELQAPPEYAPTQNLRWIVRDSGKVLQQWWVRRYNDLLYRSNLETQWRDVPIVDENDD